ncbi:MAG: ParB N-terminal domain-containing protein [Acetobacter sp.]|uniref:ParB/RepB/Spo0J family partition protein n=1 Tax=Acetobacter sp. TaxID=440 RepID=UPI0039ED954D
MNTEMILLSDIDADDRLREVDHEAALFISASIAEHGLRQPIEVRKVGKRYKLIAGGHRLQAAKILEWVDIPAIVLKATELEAKLLEIDENLFRRELSPLDRATFLATRKEVYEALHPETKHGDDRKSSVFRSMKPTYD